MSENDGLLSGRALEDVLLLLSELVTNAVRHGAVGRHEHVRVQATMEAGSLHVRVSDRGPGFRRRSFERRGSEAGGWGLVLVDELSSDWGVERRGAETAVWFDYPLGGGTDLAGAA